MKLRSYGWALKWAGISAAVMALGVSAVVMAQQSSRAPSAADKAAEASIRKNLAARLPNMPAIDEVQPSPIAGLYEVRVGGGDIIYADANADFVVQGEIVDVKAHRNLTKERLDKLAAIDFKSFPFKDAFTVVRGNGKRKMVAFEDPNCGYCKHFEAELQNVNNVTVYVFLIPILGEDSVAKARDIWCSKDRADAWEGWMIKHQAPATGKCDTAAIDRNLAFAQRYRINGTPALFFADGTRVPGAIPAAKIEAMLGKAN